MNREERKRTEESLQHYFKNYEEEYKRKVEEYINKLDFNRLQIIKTKKIADITQEDLEFIGFQKQEVEGFKEIYSFESFDSSKIYFNRNGDKFEMRGFRLKKECDILTTEELLEHSLTNWKLKMNEQEEKFKIEWSSKPPF